MVQAKQARAGETESRLRWSLGGVQGVLAELLGLRQTADDSESQQDAGG